MRIITSDRQMVWGTVAYAFWATAATLITVTGPLDPQWWSVVAGTSLVLSALSAIRHWRDSRRMVRTTSGLLF
jgi:hypothetical protein